MTCRLFGTKPSRNECWLSVGFTLENKILHELNQDAIIFILRIAFENVSCKNILLIWINLNPTWMINHLTHWGRVTHICIVKLTIIGSDNGLSPGRRQAITWTNVGILLIGPLGTNFSEMLIEIHIFSFMKIHLKKSSGKWRPFCLGLNMLIDAK